MGRSKKSVVQGKDPEKESCFRELVDKLESAGFTVRREKLRQGPGWKVLSGTCRALNQKLIFVDPRMPQDDQILFLRAKVAALESDRAPENAASGV